MLTVRLSFSEAPTTISYYQRGSEGKSRIGCELTEDEVILLKLSGTDLLLHGVSADVDVHVQLIAAEDCLQLLDVVVDSRHDGHDQDLTGTDPERPLATKVLDQDSKETLET